MERSLLRYAGAALLLASSANVLPAMAQDVPTLGVDPAWKQLPPRPPLDFSDTAIPDRARVMAALDYVASAQIAEMARRPLPLATGGSLREAASNWVAAAFYVGAARWARVSPRPDTLRFLTGVAEHYNYAFRGARSGRTLLNADDLAIGDLYQELYARRRQEGTLIPLQQRLDYSVPHLDRATETDRLVWWWCDALFMAPPVLARMSVLTGDPKYLIAMDKEWRRTAALLWNPEERLFARDARFKDMRSPNGKLVFWSRGNGWVLSGLARTLDAMPADFAGRGYYLDIYRKLAARLIELQQEDGLWRASLLDAQAFTDPETSGTAMFVHGLAWGINHGLLDRKTYQPHVLKGWAALNRHILPSGLLGAVQRTGDQPVPTKPDDVGPYGSGAYLLAGLEVAQLGTATRALPEAMPGRDDPETILATTMIPPPPATTTVSDAERQRRAAEIKAVDALTYDPDVLARPAAIEPLTPPTGDATRPRATAQYAPQRLDDILWENDRVALRIYGPALEAKEPPSSSGIDIWGKRVRWPFMVRQLKFPNYHVDRGEGLDFYDVRGGRGAGGLGIWYGNKLWTSRNWATHRILASDGAEAKFEVSYKPWPVDVARRVWETRSFALPMGSNFTRMVSTLESDSREPLVVAIGIGKRRNENGAGSVVRDAANGRLTFHEPQDAGHGAVSITIAADPALVTGFAEDADNYLMLLKVTPGRPFVYYSGYGWDRGLDIHSSADWDALVKATRFEFNPKGDRQK